MDPGSLYRLQYGEGLGTRTLPQCSGPGRGELFLGQLVYWLDWSENSSYSQGYSWLG